MEANGFSFSLSLQSNLLVIECFHRVLNRSWEVQVQELSLCKDDTVLTQLNARKVFELITGREKGRCEVVFPSDAQSILCIEFRVSFPFIGVVSAGIYLNEKSSDDITRLDKSIVEMNKVTNEKISTLERKLEEANAQIAELKQAVSNLSLMKPSGVLGVTHFSGNYNMECDDLGKYLTAVQSRSHYSQDTSQHLFTLCKLVVNKKYASSTLLVQGIVEQSSYSCVGLECDGVKIPLSLKGPRDCKSSSIMQHFSCSFYCESGDHVVRLTQTSHAQQFHFDPKYPTSIWSQIIVLELPQ